MLEDQNNEPEFEDLQSPGKFRGWRLLGVLVLVVGFIALTSAIVDRLFQAGIIRLD